MPITVEEQRELDQLELEELLAEEQAVAASLAKATRRTEKKTSLGGRPKETTPGKGRETGGLLADIAMEGGGATAGQLAGALPLLSVPTAGLSVPILGGLGGGIGNVLAQRRQIAAGERPDFSFGELTGTILSSAIPGGAQGATGARVLAKEGLKQGAGGLAAKTVETVIDRGDLPTGTEALLSAGLPLAGGVVGQKLGSKGADKLNATARKTLEDARKIGMSVTPSDVSDSWLNKRIESAAGPADVRRDFSLKNQKAANRNAAIELGLSPDTEITRPVLAEVRERSAQPYEEIGAMAAKAQSELEVIRKTYADAIKNAEITSAGDAHQLSVHLAAIEKQMADPATVKHVKSLESQGSANLQELRETRDFMNANRPPYPQADAAREALFYAAKKKVDALEQNLVDAATAAGRPELADELRKARTRKAKSHDIEKTINVGDAGVSLPILGMLVDKKKSITGKLETMGKFAEAFPRNVQEGAKVHPFGLSKTEQIVGGLAAVSGLTATGDPKAAALFLAPAAISTTARMLATSRPYQALMTAKPFAMPNAAAATRLGAQAAGQEASRPLAPKETVEEPPKEEPAAPLPKKSASLELPIFTPAEAKDAPNDTRFVGTNGKIYEKNSRGKITVVNAGDLMLA